jgi:hypothetical protein
VLGISRFLEGGVIEESSGLGDRAIEKSGLLRRVGLLKRKQGIPYFLSRCSPPLKLDGPPDVPGASGENRVYPVFCPNAPGVFGQVLVK